MRLLERAMTPLVKLRRYRVGERAPRSGQYAVYDATGARIAHRQVTMPKGHTFPPVAGVQGATFRLSDASLHVTD